MTARTLRSSSGSTVALVAPLCLALCKRMVHSALNLVEQSSIRTNSLGTVRLTCSTSSNQQASDTLIVEMRKTAPLMTTRAARITSLSF